MVSWLGGEVVDSVAGTESGRLGWRDGLPFESLEGVGGRVSAVGEPQSDLSRVLCGLVIVPVFFTIGTRAVLPEGLSCA